MPAADDQRERVLELLRRYGANTTSFQTLEPELSYWFDDAADACVAYTDTGGSWVVAGAPVCPPSLRCEVLARFADVARAKQRRVRFFLLEQDEADDADEADLSTLCVGQRPVWNPQHWPETLRAKRSLREQLRRARAKGVRVRRVSAREIDDVRGVTRRGIEGLVQSWLEGRKMAPMGFMVDLQPFDYPKERLYLVAERPRSAAGANDADGETPEVVGVMVAVPIYSTGGWFFEDTLRDPHAPNGTIELLVDHAMRELASRGCEQVTFGVTPLAGVANPLLAFVRDHTRWLYDFDGLRSFREKLRPRCWLPVFMAYPRDETGVIAIVDTLQAFAGGSFFGFLWRTLLHRAREVTLALALLLVPWIALIALPGSRAFFPSPAVQYAWVAFDLALLCASLSLWRRWRPWLAGAIGLAAAADFSVAIVQVMTFNVHQAHTLIGWAVIIASLGATLLAAAFFRTVCRENVSTAKRRR